MRSIFVTVGTTIGVALLVGCGSSTEGPGPGPVAKGKTGGPSSDLSGNIEADGSSTVYLISRDMAAAFRESAVHETAGRGTVRRPPSNRAVM